jgi:hypothetical protein
MSCTADCCRLLLLAQRDKKFQQRGVILVPLTQVGVQNPAHAGSHPVMGSAKGRLELHLFNLSVQGMCRQHTYKIFFHQTEHRQGQKGMNQGMEITLPRLNLERNAVTSGG